MCRVAAVASFVGWGGLGRSWTRPVSGNPKAKVDNALSPSGWFYRVNSIFYDPSFYGRFLGIGILACAVMVLFARRKPAWVAAGIRRP